MKVGTISFATDSGLGILAKSFYDHGIVTDVALIRHRRFESHPEWYPPSRFYDLLSPPQLQKFCRSMDVMLFFETPFNWQLIAYCRDRGVKTVLMPMHEMMPEVWPEIPDLILCPDLLTFNLYQKSMFPAGVVYLPVPVSVPWRQRVAATTFVHNAGHGGLQERNGTRQVYQALPHIKSPIKLILRAQTRVMEDLPTYSTTIKIGNVTVDYRYGTVSQENLWNEGDVFLFPEKHCGLSLPLQEAYASGMAVMAGDRFPMNQWLPKEPLIPVASTKHVRVLPDRREVEQATYDPRQIARKVDEWYCKDVASLSLQGKEWAEKHSWDVLGPKYKELLCNLKSA